MELLVLLGYDYIYIERERLFTLRPRRRLRRYKTRPPSCKIVAKRTCRHVCVNQPLDDTVRNVYEWSYLAAAQCQVDRNRGAWGAHRQYEDHRCCIPGQDLESTFHILVLRSGLPSLHQEVRRLCHRANRTPRSLYSPKQWGNRDGNWTRIDRSTVRTIITQGETTTHCILEEILRVVGDEGRGHDVVDHHINH